MKRSTKELRKKMAAARPEGWRVYEVGKWDYTKGVRKEPAFRPVINGRVYKRIRTEQWPEEASKTPARIKVSVDPTLDAWEVKVLLMGLIAEIEREARDAKLKRRRARS